MKTFYVYRHFDCDGVLLYVGCSDNPEHRNLSHAKRSKWWPLSVKMTKAAFQDRPTALMNERNAIVLEKPLFNRTHSKSTVISKPPVAFAGIEKKILNMKIGDVFTVDTETIRQRVCRTSKILRDYGAIKFRVITKRSGDAFKVAAI